MTGGLAARIGRRPPVIVGRSVAGAGVLGMEAVDGSIGWLIMAGVSGRGTTLYDPRLMTVSGDASHPSSRASGTGVYRMWRDAGYGVGASLIGLAIREVSLEAAFVFTGVATFVSGIAVYAWMGKTHPEFGTHTPPTTPVGRAQPMADD